MTNMTKQYAILTRKVECIDEPIAGYDWCVKIGALVFDSQEQQNAALNAIWDSNTPEALVEAWGYVARSNEKLTQKLNEMFAREESESHGWPVVLEAFCI